MVAACSSSLPLPAGAGSWTPDAAAGATWSCWPVRHGHRARAGGAQRRRGARARRGRRRAGLARRALPFESDVVRPRGVPGRARARRRTTAPRCASCAGSTAPRRPAARRRARLPLAVGGPRRAVGPCAPLHPRLAAGVGAGRGLAAGPGDAGSTPRCCPPSPRPRADAALGGRRAPPIGPGPHAAGGSAALLGRVLAAEARSSARVGRCRSACRSSRCSRPTRRFSPSAAARRRSARSARGRATGRPRGGSAARTPPGGSPRCARGRSRRRCRAGC